MIIKDFNLLIIIQDKVTRFFTFNVMMCINILYSLILKSPTYNWDVSRSESRRFSSTTYSCHVHHGFRVTYTSNDRKLQLLLRCTSPATKRPRHSSARITDSSGSINVRSICQASITCVQTAGSTITKWIVVRIQILVCCTISDVPRSRQKRAHCTLSITECWTHRCIA